MWRPHLSGAMGVREYRPAQSLRWGFRGGHFYPIVEFWYIPRRTLQEFPYCAIYSAKTKLNSDVTPV